MQRKKIERYFEINWKEISSHVGESLVVMDDPSAECLHWNGGLEILLDRGVHSIENFSPFVKADGKVKKIVFVLMSPFTEEILRTMMIIVRANTFKSCTVFTSLSTKYHNEHFNDFNAFANLEDRLLSWLGNMNYMACIYYVPTFFTYVSTNCIMMPSMFKSLSIHRCGSLEMNSRRNEAIALKMLSNEMQSSLKQISCSLHSLLETNEMRGDFFSLGPLSHLLCSELENISQLHKKTYPSKASVVIVDRLLDLAGPLSQSYDTMFDKIKLALPNIKGHVFDVNISMADLASCQENTVFERPLLAPGCLAHRRNALEESALNFILCKKPREVLIELNRLIVECASKEGISLDLNSRLSPDILKKRVLSFKQKPDLMLKYCGLLQQVLGVIQAMEYCAINNIDNLCAVEKALIEYLATSGEEVLNYIMQMISEKDEMNYKMEDILVFLAFFYMLYEENEIDNESAMQATLMEIFFQENMGHLRNLIVNTEVEHGDDHILDGVRTFFDVVKRLSTVRKGFKKYLTLFKSTNPAFPATYDSLLKQLVVDILNPSLTDISDLEFHSAGLKDYIKTGFSLFMNVTKPKPRDNPVIFLVILGGATPSEIKFIQEISSQNKGTEVILLCSGVLKPFDVLKDIGLIVQELVSNIEDDT